MSLFRKLVSSENLPPHKNKITIASPLTGRVKPLDEMPVALFRERLLGEGIVIEPSGYQIIAPFDCKIEQLPKTGEQIRLRSAKGVQLLIQIGWQAENMMGEGFKLYAGENDVVRKGQIILDFDLRKLKNNLKTTLCPVTVLNSNKIAGLLPYYHQVLAGEDDLFSLFI